MNENEKTKKISSILIKLTTVIILVFTIFIMIFTVVTVTTVDRNDRSIFGIKFYIVQTDSMSLSENNKDLDVHFSAGDIVLIKNVKDITTLEAGDVISFLSTNEESYGETVTHMIREVKKDSNGKLLGFVTYGTNTGVDDKEMVEPEYVIGRYVAKLAGVGRFFAFLRTPRGYVFCILLPFVILIVYYLIKVVKLAKQYKKERNLEIENEREQIAEERKRNEEMLRELMALKEQLEAKKADNESDVSDN